jgi:hypothetical protein
MIELLQDIEKSFITGFACALLQELSESSGSGFSDNFHGFCGKLDLYKPFFLFDPDSFGMEIRLKTGTDMVIRMGYRIAVYGSFTGQ